MNIILLSGGSGKRLWPLSNDVRSKQFIKLFKNNDEYESMVQRVYRQITTVEANAKITIATSKSQASAIKNQLGEKASICVEPCRRDTFPAIALAAAYLHDELGVAENEAVVVCPVDPYVDNTYYEAVKTLQELAEQGGSNLTLMGIEPTYPSEKYGYIIPESGENVSKVKEFKEKPDVETAKKYLAQSALWNAGIFAFKLGYLLDKAHSMIEFEDYRDLFNKYDTLTKISFDYAVVEKESSIQVLRYSGDWKDVGTWNMMAEVMADKTKGKAILDETCENTNVINELNIPILCIITVRSIVSNIVCLFLLLILVRDREDYNIYAFISSLPIIINSIWNFFYIRKYVHPRFTVNLNLKTHLKPLTIIFFNTITALIYVNADITMLGWIKGDSVVGEYTIAVKVYTVIKNILVAIYAAVTPRLATMMSETAESQYKKLNTTIWCYLSLILIPAGFGLTAVSKDVMLLVGGEEIATTSFSLQILSISLIFAIYGGLITSVYNITQGREKENLMATTVSAIINCGLNLYMIPKYSLYGAAFTTLLSELFVFVFCTLRAPNKKRFFDVDEIKNSILYAVVGSILVLLTTKVVYMLVECSALLRLIIAVALSAVVYITYLIIFKNKYTIDIVRNIMVKIKKKY